MGESHGATANLASDAIALPGTVDLVVDASQLADRLFMPQSPAAWFSPEMPVDVELEHGYTLQFAVRRGQEFAAGSHVADVAHSTGRIALELGLVATIVHRLDGLLSAAVESTLRGEASAPFVFLDQTHRVFRITEEELRLFWQNPFTSRYTAGTSYLSFEVVEVHPGSTKVRHRIKVASVAVGAIGTILVVTGDAAEAAKKIMEAGQSGYTMIFNRDEEKRKQLADDMYNQLVVEVQKGNYRMLQDYLRAAGHDPGKSDGVVGPMTRGAIEGFEKANGLPVTGSPKGSPMLRILTRLAAEKVKVP
ncbi:peptidoglycan-binding domain-containing protein [Teichococcus coralli]|nr:peptidoglycan-binding domain-containing protein [Pseudoroseomonas coralli]